MAGICHSHMYLTREVFTPLAGFTDTEPFLPYLRRKHTLLGFWAIVELCFPTVPATVNEMMIISYATASGFTKGVPEPGDGKYPNSTELNRCRGQLPAGSETVPAGSLRDVRWVSQQDFCSRVPVSCGCAQAFWLCHHTDRICLSRVLQRLSTWLRALRLRSFCLTQRECRFMFGSLLYSWNLFDINFQITPNRTCGTLQNCLPHVYRCSLPAFWHVTRACRRPAVMPGCCSRLPKLLLLNFSMSFREKAWAKQLEELQEEPEEPWELGMGLCFRSWAV